MNECNAKYYKNNTIVTHSPLVCFGGLGQPPCQYLTNCMQENGVVLKKKRVRKNKA